MVSIDSYIVAALVAYVLLCALLRCRQKHAIEAKFQTSLGAMTLLQAYEIQKWLGEQEFPATFSASIFFALFKAGCPDLLVGPVQTYGVPSISQLLVVTGQIADNHNPLNLEKTSKRAADTSVLLTNMVIGRPGSRRAIQAAARTRFLHAAYRKNAKISDDDMLYTLSLFVLEPIRWVAQYEWRCLTDLERCAMATFWKALGEDLDIPYDRLPSSQKEGGWADALHWLRELDEWSRAYAHYSVRVDKSNTILAGATMDMLLYRWPEIVKPAGQCVFSVILGSDVCNAMGLPYPPPYYEAAFRGMITIRKFVIRHLCLPRPYFLRRRHLLDHPDPQTGHYNVARWRVHPWYARPSSSSFKSLWGIRNWLRWMRGGPPPSQTENKFLSAGYKIREVGPQQFIGKGGKEMDKIEEALRGRNLEACPFASL